MDIEIQDITTIKINLYWSGEMQEDYSNWHNANSGIMDWFDPADEVVLVLSTESNWPLRPAVDSKFNWMKDGF